MQEQATTSTSSNNNKATPLLADPYSIANTKEALRAINKSTARWSSRRILTDQELRTKKWLDQRIAEISAREAAAESLKSQYEQQLELLNRKESLEALRQQQMTNSTTNNSNDTSGEDDNAAALLSAQEEAKLLELIEQRLSSIDGQLNVRSRRISDIHKKIFEAGDVAGSERIVDALKKTAAGTLPGSHELIRLLMEMLIQSNKTIQMRTDTYHENLEREKALQQKIEQYQDQLTAERHRFDQELTRRTSEYENKLQELFQQIATLEYLFNNNNNEKRHDSSTTENMIESASIATAGNNNNNNSNNTQTIVTTTTNTDAKDVQLAIIKEERSILKVQLERETFQYAQLYQKYQELEKMKQTLIRDLEDKNLQIRFLEEDRALFKGMVDDLKVGLVNMGKPGKTVLESAKDRALQKNTDLSIPTNKGGEKRDSGIVGVDKGLGVGLFRDYITLNDEGEGEKEKTSSSSNNNNDRQLPRDMSLFMKSIGNDDEEDEDDSISLLGEYELLGEEIHRTGVVQIHQPSVSSSQKEKEKEAPLQTTTFRSNSAGKERHTTMPSDSTSIYDRLYNPSSYTGHMKAVFDLDIENRRKRTQLLRKQEKLNIQVQRKDMYVNNQAPTSGGRNSLTSATPPALSYSASTTSSANPTPSMISQPLLPNNNTGSTNTNTINSSNGSIINETSAVSSILLPATTSGGPVKFFPTEQQPNNNNINNNNNSSSTTTTTNNTIQDISFPLETIDDSLLPPNINTNNNQNSAKRMSLPAPSRKMAINPMLQKHAKQHSTSHQALTAMSRAEQQETLSANHDINAVNDGAFQRISRSTSSGVSPSRDYPGTTRQQSSPAQFNILGLSPSISNRVLSPANDTPRLAGNTNATASPSLLMIGEPFFGPSVNPLNEKRTGKSPGSVLNTATNSTSSSSNKTSSTSTRATANSRLQEMIDEL